MILNNKYSGRDFAELSTMIKVFIYIVCSILFAIILYFIVLSKQNNLLRNLKNKEQKLKEHYAKVYPQVRQIHLLKLQMQKLNKFYDKNSQKWEFTNQAKVSRQITTYAKRYNLHVSLVRFNDEDKLHAIIICPIKIIATGDLDNLKNFLFILTKYFFLLDYQLTSDGDDFIGEFKVGLLA